MHDAEFWSSDRRFGLLMPDALLEQLYARCYAAGANETGSILVGHYRDRNRLAIVTDLPSTPSDSRASAMHFERGTLGLRRLLGRLWQRDRYYLGEWHYHPDAAPFPSARDDQQMREVAASDRFRCPEPILLIVGGSSSQRVVCAQVYPAGTRVPLRQQTRRARVTP